jgi:hypothetical protein
MTLVEFLRARLDEDEREASRVEPNQAPNQLRALISRDGGQPFLVIDSARVLAEVEAKRQLIAQYERYDAWAKYPDSEGGMAMGLDLAVQFAALPYAGDSDYREEWRP